MVKTELLSAFGLNEQILLADGSPLTLQEAVRVLPNQRLVCKALWQKQLVYAKFFVGNRAATHAKRDADGASTLMTAGIATPPLLYQQIDTSLCVLVYEAIMPSENMAYAWQHLEQSKRLVLAQNIVRTVAQHHNANLLQSDMHLKNFLLKEDVIYTLDGDGIRQFPALKINQAVDNFCVLLSKFDVLDIDVWLIQLIETYQQARGNGYNLEVDEVKRSIKAYRKWAVIKYAEEKVFRQCTDVHVSRHVDRFVAISSQFSHLDIPQDSQSLDVLIDSQPRLKSGNTCTVSLVHIKSIGVVIKRYNIKNLFHCISRLLRQTRASASWENAHRLQLLGLPTPKPIALIEKRRFGLRGKAYFLSEYIDAPDAATFFADTKDKTSACKID